MKACACGVRREKKIVFAFSFLREAVHGAQQRQLNAKLPSHVGMRTLKKHGTES